MADASNYTVTNTAAGPRGINTVDGYAELAPGETRKVDLSAGEHAVASKLDYFTFGEGGAAAKAPSPPDNDGNGEGGGSLPSNPMQLKAIARAESIDVTGLTKGDELKAAILAGRKAKAAQAAGGGASDDLDKMDDDTLRTTAAALSGKSVEELADQDRDALLKLARGE